MSPARSRAHQRIATGSGYIVAAKVTVNRLDTLGKRFRQVTTIAHTLPFDGAFDGLLGMDLMCRMKAKILTATGAVEIP